LLLLGQEQALAKGRLSALSLTAVRKATTMNSDSNRWHISQLCETGLPGFGLGAMMGA
jgi:hypothetical protein